MAPPSPAPEEKAKRVRELLSSYYGAEGGDGTLHDDGSTANAQGSEGRAAASPPAPRVAGLDSPNFEADRCAVESAP